MPPCSCEKGKGTWKAYDSKGKLIKAFGATDADEVKAKAEAKRAGGFAKRG